MGKQSKNRKVFISHSWEDNEIARKLAEELKSVGVEIWIDYTRIKGGDNLPVRISEALKWCDTLLLVWSKSAASSYYVNLEWENALDQRKIIVPCVTDDTKRPAILRGLLYIDFRDFKKGLSELFKAFDLNLLEKRHPEEIADQGMPAVLEYSKVKAKGIKQVLNEAKILFVGQGAVGKTSLVNRLLDNTFNPNETKTEGIDIRSIPIQIQGREIRVNIWDFGGQEIMHATHQFFLTKRSLYVLVWDGRKEESSDLIAYWLKLIQSFGSDSPIIIVLNKIDENVFEIDRRGLQKKFLAIKGFVNTSCKSNSGIKELREIVYREVSQLKHLRIEWPESWFRIKKCLEEMDVDYMAYSEYVRLCENEKISILEQTTLIQFLHDLGTVLNFSDDIRLRDTNILNPRWVTGGVYKILNSKIVAKNKGVLGSHLLSTLLNDEKYPSDKHLFIINMMKKFELCFELDNSGQQQFLIPELLPKEEPNFKWIEEDSLTFQYHYDFLPSSIITRFIVRIHSFVFNNIYWKNGVLLSDINNKALVKSDPEARRIYIWINGYNATRRGFLAVIRSHFEHIHSTISKIAFEEKIPLYPGKNIVVDYNYLIGLESRGIKTFNAEKTFEKFNVKKLLDGVEEPGRRGIRRKRSVTDKPQNDDIIELKPNFFGLGLNLNALWRKIKQLFFR